jgi:hypothetical protein
LISATGVNVFEKEYKEKPFQLMESPEIHGNAWEIKKICINYH